MLRNGKEYQGTLLRNAKASSSYLFIHCSIRKLVLLGLIVWNCHSFDNIICRRNFFLEACSGKLDSHPTTIFLGSEPLTFPLVEV